MVMNGNSVESDIDGGDEDDDDDGGDEVVLP